MFEKTFCPSPWFHTRINNSGTYHYCRWAKKDPDQVFDASIADQTPVIWFQKGMSRVRKDMLDGKPLAGCADCYQMEQHGKVSGRQKQLLKIGVTERNFAGSMLASDWFSVLDQSAKTNGDTDQLPLDWQIDLGNFCNSACVFCHPYSSSRLAAEFRHIGLINQMPPRAWTDDPALVQSFIDILIRTPEVAYLHFIGGETMITPAFRSILLALIEHKIAPRVTIGFTTNLTVWDDSLVDLLCQFQQVNLGMSVECFHPVNDYARFGSDLQQVKSIIDRWLSIKDQYQWLAQIRVTPTVLTVPYLDTIYQFAMERSLAVESCNFLDDPAFMRPSVLPTEHRQEVIEKLLSWTRLYPISTDNLEINTRNTNIYQTQLVQDAHSYIDYLKHEPDESFRLPDLAAYLMRLEKHRGNSVLQYLPQYEKFLRAAGYQG